jgi:hypothetical protein
MPRPEKLHHVLDRIRMCVEDGRYRITWHARLRQQQRSIILPDILFVLLNGRHEKMRDQFDEAFLVWNYAIRGMTPAGDDVRVVVSFDQENFLLVITAFCVHREGSP